MYEREGFDRYGEVNFSHIIHAQKNMKDIDDVLSKAFYAGLVSHYAQLIIFGTGAERGTWYQFANIKLNGLTFSKAQESLTWFTNIYSLARRNQGNEESHRKKNFWLSQLQEIQPLLTSFGLADEFEQKWQEIRAYDSSHGLKEEWESNGKIANWKTRTKTETISFSDREDTIMDSVVSDILDNSSVPELMKMHGIQEPSNVLSEFFIEGTRGLTLTSDDMTALLRGESILRRYSRAA